MATITASDRTSRHVTAPILLPESDMTYWGDSHRGVRHECRDASRCAGHVSSLTRRTQTNEPARCATLLPALAQLPQPLALIEAGASAGLTLLFDRYSYDYAGHRLAGCDPHAPALGCEPCGPVPLPPHIPAIIWRAELDLNPLDVTRDDDVRWLSCLVWPGEGDRGQRLAAAIASARRDPPACTAVTCSQTCPHWRPRRQ